MNKKVKIMILVAIILIFAILIKQNVTIKKEEVPNKKEITDVTKLDIKSKLVKDIYKNLNMNLINNTCEDFEKCLINENYLYLYYEDNKKLSDDEMLYMIINKIYKDGKYSIISESAESGDKPKDDTTKIVIDKLIVKEELKNLFNKKYENFDNKLIQSNSCGIKEYTFTGEAYELTIKKCKSKKEFVLSRVVKATKKGDHIVLVIEKYLENEDLESNKRFVESKENRTYEQYNFSFKLIEDKYYLEKITKNK